MRDELPSQQTARGPSPEARGPRGRQASSGDPVPGASLRGRHVLVVDDDVSAAAVISKTLRRAGAMVSTYSDGLSALRAIDDTHVDLLVTDICMPKMTGTDLVRLSRAHGFEGHVIVITGYPDSEDLAEALGDDVRVVLFKPVDGRQLLRATRDLRTVQAMAMKDRGSLAVRARVAVCVDRRESILQLRLLKCFEEFHQTHYVDDMRHLDFGSVDALVISNAVCSEHRSAVATAVSNPFNAGLVLVRDVRHPQHLREDAVVHASTDNSDDTILIALYKAVAMAARRRLQQELAEQIPFAPHAIAVLQLTCIRASPPLTVSEAAEYLGVDRAVADWHMTSFAHRCPRFKDAMDWVLLWRVVSAKRRDQTWKDSARLVGLTDGRFRAIADRLTGRSPGSLLSSDEWRVTAPFDTIRDFGVRPG